MEWPSKNVPKGSVFNNAKMNYSPETRQFLQTLMNESKMSMFQRNKINYCLRNGEPLAPITTPSTTRRAQKPIIRPGTSKRRSLETIRMSGAYERDNFRPMQPHIDREKAKEALVNLMAYGNPKPPKTTNPKERKSTKQQPVMNRYEELKQEIKEREDWLAEMEELGEGPKYRSLIRLQILERLKEIDSLDVQK